MPVLNRKHPLPDASTEASHLSTGTDIDGSPTGANRPGLFLNCSNAGCRTGWLHFRRSRTGPVFESGWTCSHECTAARVARAVARESNARGAPEAHRHRLPLGLLMLEKGWITADQLRKARESQRVGGGRVGEWLIKDGATSETLLTRALSLQWSCPVIPATDPDCSGLAPILPRLFSEAFGAQPLRVAAGKLLYLGYEERPDPILALALERMTGLRIESGIVQGSLFERAHTRYLGALFPLTEFLEAVSEQAMVRVFTRAIERSRPVQARLVRVHDWFWMRLWRKQQAGPVPDRESVLDVICTLPGE